MNMPPNLVLSVARDFSTVPAGRTKADGQNSGARFRDDFLYPALRNGEVITVELDGVEGYGSSFLEEAFGGLVRRGLNPDDVISRIQLVSKTDPSLIDEIREYILDAAKEGTSSPR
jgi:hypothetical protein